MEVDFRAAEINSLDIAIRAEGYDVLFSLDDGFFNDTDDNFNFPYHSHAEHELHIMTLGAGTMYLGDKQVRLAEGACCLIPPNVYHTQGMEPGVEVRKFCLHFTVSGRDGEAGAGRSPFDPGKYYIWQDDGAVLGQIRRVHRELDEVRPFQQSMLRACFTELFITILRASGRSDDGHDSGAVGQSELRRIAKIEYFFNANYSRKLTIDDLADELYISRRQVSREVRRYFGMSFKEKLMTTRVEIAKGFLEQGNGSIEGIALSVGYDSLASFSTAFKQRVGVPPSVYRRHSNNRRR